MPSEPSNRLRGESSPYLRQHAHNPVDWYPWGDEALALARAEDRPILLSVGYSACHWCHVMARESFEDPAIAALMNEHFVNIKVDREERPDLDEVYMSAVQAISGSGGWPMTVFLTPQLQPFYGGTYFPPEDRYGRPGFPRVLTQVAGHFRDRREQVEEQAGRLLALLDRGAANRTPGERLTEETLEAARGAYAESYDEAFGGFGQAPKFPGAMGLLFLLRRHWRADDTQALRMVEHTLTCMARGGVYDQLGGGFHRYSVDERWLVPHFEKMLYDNALLAWCYTEAYQATGRPLYRDVVTGTLDYVRREMERPEGGYWSTQDADTEGEEGRYYVWRREEVEAALQPGAAAAVCARYGVTAEGNFENGANVLHIASDLASVAGELGRSEAEVEEEVAASRSRLLELRQRRRTPTVDDKVIAAWNGLMVTAMARAGRALGKEEYVTSASRAATALTDELCRDGRLYHSARQGRLGVPGFQDDYAAVIGSLLDLYEATLEAAWLTRAAQLAQEMVERFWDGEGGGFCLTESGTPNLIVRPRPVYDLAVPSGSALATLALLRLGAMTGEARWRDLAESVLSQYSELLERAPTACGMMLCALEFAAAPPLEVALAGPAAGVRLLLSALHRDYLPHKVVVRGDDAPGGRALAYDRAAAGRAAAFVCRDSVCSPPVTEATALVDLLSAGER